MALDTCSSSSGHFDGFFRLLNFGLCSGRNHRPLSFKNLRRPKQNLSRDEQKALHELKQNNDINLKKSGQGQYHCRHEQNWQNKGGRKLTTNKLQTSHRIHGERNSQQGLAPYNWPTPWKPHHCDDMTKKWLSQTPNPPRIPEFYTLTKIQKPTITTRPIILSCDGPTERILSFVDTLLQPISKSQKSYLKIQLILLKLKKTLKKKRRWKNEHFLYQWTSQVSTQTYHTKRELI